MIPGFTVRPIDAWPGEDTKNRQRAKFSAGWGLTLDLLASELRQLGAKRGVVQIAVEEREIVMDGTRPKSTARPRHPGIILAFDSKYGPMKISCDRFDSWQDNARAIALGLHDLRRLDRYGITKRGEQYTGWRALPPGKSDAITSREDAIEVLAAESGIPPNDIDLDLFAARAAYRAAAKRTHPDTGGDAVEFSRVQRAWELLQR